MKSKLFLMLALVFLVTHADDHLHSSATDLGLTFHANYDSGADAVWALGDPVASPDKRVEFAPGILGNGLRIGKNADKLYAVSYAADKNLPNVNFTISFWLKAENWTGADRGTVLFVTGRKAGGCFFIYKYQGPNLLFYNAEGKDNVSARENIDQWQPGEWHHIGVSCSDIALKLYVDGKLRHTVQRPESTHGSWSRLEIGARSWEIEDGTAILDELKIFNRVLPDSEIEQEFNRLSSALPRIAAKMQITVGKGQAKIDGQVQPGEYATEGTGFFNPGGTFAGRQGRYALTHDNDNLYCAIVTPQKVPPKADRLAHDDQQWLDDSVEVWLENAEGTRFQIIGNTKNAITDIRIAKNSDLRWNCRGLRMASQLANEEWTAEFALPLSEFAPGPWNINLCRSIRSEAPPEYLSLAPVRKNRGFSDADNFARLHLSQDAPPFAIKKLGNINAGKIDFSAEVPQSVTLAYSTNERTWFRENIPADKGQVTFSRDFQPGGILQIDIPDLFKVEFAAPPPSPVSIQYICTDIAGKKLLSILKNASGAGGGKVVVSLIDKKTNATLEHEIPVEEDRVFWTDAWDIASLPAGDYSYEGVFVASDGSRGEKFSQYYRMPGEVVPWENNTIGKYPGEVPSPWISLQSGDSDVRTLMQHYQFGANLFFSGFASNNQQLLNRPCEIKVNKTTISNGVVRKIMAGEDAAKFRAEGSSGKLKIVCDILVEYDGFCCFDLAFSGEGVDIEEISIDIPVKKEFAKQVHSCDGDTHRAAFGATGLLDENIWHKNLYNKPAFWVGNDEAGLAWYAETLKNWRPGDKKRTVEILPGRDERIIRLHIVDRPFKLNGTRNILFFLHGTPVKHPNREIRTARLNREWGWSDASLYFNYLDGGKEFFDVEYLSAHQKRYQKLGATRFFLYIASNGASPYCPEWGYFGKLWTSRPIGDYIIEQNITSLARRNKWVWTYSCLNSQSFREFYLWQLANVLNDPRFGIKNLYYDLVGPRMCDNAEHGCGYRDDDGISYPSQNILGGRDFHKRIYHYCQKTIPGALHLYHVTGQPIVPGVHSFCDAIVEGETFFGNELPDKETYFGILSPEMFRTAYYGQKWGYPSIFIPQLARSAWAVRPERVKLWQSENPPEAMQQAMKHFLGYAYAHDISIWTGTRAMQTLHDRYWKKQAEFLGGWDSLVHFIPYWDTSKPFIVSSNVPDRIMASAYQRGERFMLIVMNDTNNSQPITVDISAMKASSAENIDDLQIPINNGFFLDTIAPQSFTAYFIK
jgi:hypothetical protein